MENLQSSTQQQNNSFSALSYLLHIVFVYLTSLSFSSEDLSTTDSKSLLSANATTSGIISLNLKQITTNAVLTQAK